MSRLARTISESKVYHILFRGVNQQNIFEETSDFEKLKETIATVKQDLHFEIYAYCFMSNHVHIVLKEKNIGEDWYYLDEAALKEMGIEYANETYVVNYKLNVVIALSEEPNIHEKIEYYNKEY